MPEDDAPIDAGITYEDAVYTYAIPGGSVTLITEFRPNPGGITTSGRQLVVYLHPEYGTATFYVELNEHATWISETKPPFITDEMVSDIGCKLEDKC